MSAPSVDATGLKSLSAAATELQNIISTFVKLIDYPGGLSLTNAQIAAAIIAQVDANNFSRHNQDQKIVEAHATFTAKNSSAQQVFELLVIWDADNPPVGANVTQTAHFGWEIYLNGTRQSGPGHVFFTKDIILPNYRIPNLQQKEVSELRLTKKGTLGTGSMESVTRYFKLS
ncbi:hypothetical protein QBC35DRAFT_483640 [Podospora australis]|uniref:Uncharacterized protein n=1 Tax=Podospora australis TaxID=1536484 RepID=A0AAN6X1R2_9PEZI|nr:hypothetical protein QBC35DRAFT_483640 [Podospora australis]